MHWSVILSVFGFIGSISTFILAILIDGKMMTQQIFPESILEWAALLGVGFSSLVVQISFTQALKYETAATVSLERKAADVIFAFLYQVTIFRVGLNKQDIIFEKSLNHFPRNLCITIIQMTSFIISGSTYSLQCWRSCSNFPGIVNIRNKCNQKRKSKE